MIGTTLNFIIKQAEKAVNQQVGSAEDAYKILLTTTLDPESAEFVEEMNVLLLKVTGIGQETMVNVRAAAYPAGYRMPLHLHLNVLVAVHFRKELLADGLDILSHFISYLQANPVWNTANTPGLPEGLENIVFEMNEAEEDTGDPSERGYLPCVGYRIKWRFMQVDETRDIPVVRPE